MTACVDNKEKKGGAVKAVSATLAGVLAVGMVPAVALADTVDGSEEATDEIGLLAAEGGFENSVEVGYRDNGNVETEIEEGEEIELAFTGTSHYVAAVNLELADGDDTLVTAEAGNTYKFEYYAWDDAKDDWGATAISPNTIQNPGNYKLTITYIGEGNYNGQKKEIPFSIVAEETDPNITIGTITTVADGKATATTDSIVFSNIERSSLFARQVGSLAISIDGAIMDPKALKGMEVYRADKTEADAEIESTDILYAGDYIATFTYDDDGDAGTADIPAVVPFTVAPLDLASATVVGEVVDAAPQKLDTVKYDIAGVNETANGLDELLEVTYSAAKNDGLPQASITEEGAYTFTLGLKDTEDEALKASITGTKDFEVKFVTNKAEITYGETKDSFSTAIDNKIYVIGGDGMFSADEVNFTYTDEEDSTEKDVPEKYCSVTVKNAAGEAVTDWATTPGKYTVVAEVTDGKCVYGGVATAAFEVTYGQVDAADGVYVRYNGQLTDGDAIVKTYDGENLIDGVTVKVVKGEREMTAGTDYELVWTDLVGNPVTEIVDAGSYKLTVKPLTFSFENNIGNVISITVNPIQPTAIRVANQVTIDEGEYETDEEGKPDYSKPLTETGLAYTGSAITPVIEYTTDESGVMGDSNSGTADEDATWTVLPAETYTLAYRYDKAVSADANDKYVDEILEVGDYYVEITLNANVKNYQLNWVNDESDTIDCDDVNVSVIDARSFLDVPVDAWYAEYVSDAASQGYIFGYNHGDFFGPMDSIKRGDVCMILARMAGIPLAADEGYGNTDNYYTTPFVDVDGHAYYAQAIAWASNAKIVTGYEDGTNEFRPESPVTREEFATMLSRYAQQAGDFEEADIATELAKYGDGSAVSTWAQNAVAWASAEGIMTGYAGTDVMAPGQNVSRAEVAKMAIVYQPEAL